MNGKELKYLERPVDPLMPLTTETDLPLDTVLEVNTDGDSENDIPLFYFEEPFEGFPTRYRSAVVDPADGVSGLENLKDVKNTDDYFQYLLNVLISNGMESDEYIAFKATNENFLTFLQSKKYQRFLTSTDYKAFQTAYDTLYFDKPSHIKYMEFLAYLLTEGYSKYRAYQLTDDYLDDKEMDDFSNDYTAITAYTDATEYLVYLDQKTAYDNFIARTTVLKYTNSVEEMEFA